MAILWRPGARKMVTRLQTKNCQNEPLIGGFKASTHYIYIYIFFFNFSIFSQRRSSSRTRSNIFNFPKGNKSFNHHNAPVDRTFRTCVKLVNVDVTSPHHHIAQKKNAGAPGIRQISAAAQDGDLHLVIHGGARFAQPTRWIIRDLGPPWDEHQGNNWDIQTWINL